MSSDKSKFALGDDEDDEDFHAPPSLSYVLPQPQQPQHSATSDVSLSVSTFDYNFASTNADSAAVELPEFHDNEEELELKLAQEGHEDAANTSSGPSSQKPRQFTRWKLIRLGVQIFLCLICLKLISLIAAGSLLSYIYYVVTESSNCLNLPFRDHFSGQFSLSSINTVKLNLYAAVAIHESHTGSLLYEIDRMSSYDNVYQTFAVNISKATSSQVVSIHGDVEATPRAGIYDCRDMHFKFYLPFDYTYAKYNSSGLLNMKFGQGASIEGTMANPIRFNSITAEPDEVHHDHSIDYSLLRAKITIQNAYADSFIYIRDSGLVNLKNVVTNELKIDTHSRIDALTLGSANIKIKTPSDIILHHVHNTTIVNIEGGEGSISVTVNPYEFKGKFEFKSSSRIVEVNCGTSNVVCNTKETTHKTGHVYDENAPGKFIVNSRGPIRVEFL